METVSIFHLIVFIREVRFVYKKIEVKSYFRLFILSISRLHLSMYNYVLFVHTVSESWFLLEYLRPGYSELTEFNDYSRQSEHTWQLHFRSLQLFVHCQYQHKHAVLTNQSTVIPISGLFIITHRFVIFWPSYTRLLYTIQVIKNR